MRYHGLARSMDAEGNTIGAAWGYELSLRGNRGDAIDLRLDLVALYVVASDTGFASAKAVDTRFVDGAYYRAKELLEEGLRYQPEHPEYRAWLIHLDERVLGAPADEDLLASLALDPAGEFARLMLYVGSGRRDYRESANAIFRWAAERTTERQRYYMSYAPATLG